MASISESNPNFILLICRNPNPIEAEIPPNEITISTNDVLSWDLPSIISYHTVKVEANRSRLIEQSSYFHCLLSGSFSESCLDCIPVQWNLEIFMNVLKCIYGCQLDIASNNFLSLFESAIYFGVERLLLKCKTWFSEISSLKGSGKLELDDLVHIWNFGLEQANDFVPELCVSYLARNFMLAVSSESFKGIPYLLLQSCIKHPHLTVDSEMHLSDALLVWLGANTEQFESLSGFEDKWTDILKQIRVSLLPLWYAAGKRRSCYFSKLAAESIDSIFTLLKSPYMSLMNVLEDGDLNHFRIRLTEHSKKVRLSGCPQISTEILLLSVLPPSYNTDHIFQESVRQFLLNLECLNRKCLISSGMLPTLSFEAVEKVDISKCPRIHISTAIECFSKSFPSLRKLKAAYLLNFKTITLYHLVHKCPLVCEIDLSVDISPVIPAQLSVASSSLAITPPESNKSFSFGDNHLDGAMLYHPGLLLSNLTKLTLEGRSDICDSDLQYMSNLHISLSYLNIRGCISVTDVGISNLIQKCSKLHSISVCDTSFGINSVRALCYANPTVSDFPAAHFGKESIGSLASKLQMLHMGGCRGADETSLVALMSEAQVLKNLCLRDSHLSDHVLYSFSGSSLEMLDVSNTVVAEGALAHVVHANPGLKCLKARGCKNLVKLECDPKGDQHSYSSSLCKELFLELRKSSTLQEIALGWGFSCVSLEGIKHASTSLRKITVGLGGSLGEDALSLLPITFPLLESVILHFQVISNRIVFNLGTLRHLRVMALCYCFGSISISSFRTTPYLRKLRLERVTPWMTNKDLVILTQNCENLIELSLIGCTLLNSDTQQIISCGWPGLISIHLEDCGEVTGKGVSSLFDLKALEFLLLRHSGPGILKSFILDAASKMPMLRQISLDTCDASEGDFDIPNYADRYFLSNVKIARCISQRCTSILARPIRVHKETLVLVWNSKSLSATVVKERL